jgi:Skp family chaperone for outer membrane proteins
MKLMFPKRFVFPIAALLALTLLATASLRAAEARIGLVDLKRVFDGYYKTKQADAGLKERVADAEKVMKGMGEDYQKAQEDYKKLVDSSNDQAVSAEEREKRKKNAEAKLTELQDIERSVRQFRGTTQTALEEQKRRMREEILTYLKGVIASHAKKGNYTHILDSAAESRNETQVLLYTTGQGDITDDVLAEINANAPAETPETKPKTDAKPLPDVLNPNAKKDPTKDKK